VNRYDIVLKKLPPQTDYIFYEYLKRDIEHIILNNSGGMNFSDLISELFSKSRYLKLDYKNLLQIIIEDDRLKVLEYRKTLGFPSYFIYIP
jgi:hypothetical protein